MKAMVVNSFGDQSVFDLQDVPPPKPKTNEVLVKVQAVSVNRTRDLNVADGSVVGADYLPIIPGQDPAGEIAGLGKGVDGLKLGQRVIVHSRMTCGKCAMCKSGNDAECRKSTSIGIHRPGGYAEFVAVPAKQCFPISKKLSFGEAAVIMRHFPMAMQQLDRKVQLKRGEWVLVMGASGGLGSACVQVAKYRGAKVIAGAGSDQRVKAALALGADYGINYRRQKLSKRIRDLTEGRGVDVVCENISDPTTWPEALKSMGRNSRLVTSGAHGGGVVPVDMKYLYHNRITLFGTAGADRCTVDTAFAGANRGKFIAKVDLELPLSELTRAFDMIADRQVEGKIIINPAL